MYQSPRGKLLQTMESQYLKRSITVSCKQNQLQIGGLDWECGFIDCSLYQNYYILDVDAHGDKKAHIITGNSHSLPFQSDSVDLIILPHLLEFDKHRFQTLREVERVLKAGGELIILSFNPFSFSVRYQLLLESKLSGAFQNHFISRLRVHDWLKLMNFGIIHTVEFNIDTFTIRPGAFKLCRSSFFSMAYGVKAVKKRYTLIPVGMNTQTRSQLVTSSKS